jgi:hypothetical protein
MTIELCTFIHKPVNGGGECGQARYGGDHDADQHRGCTGVDAENCMLHQFEHVVTNPVLVEFDLTVDAILRLGESVGFVGIAKGKGMDSVAAIIGDLRRAIVRVS